MIYDAESEASVLAIYTAWYDMYLVYRHAQIPLLVSSIQYVWQRVTKNSPECLCDDFVPASTSAS